MAPEAEGVVDGGGEFGPPRLVTHDVERLHGRVVVRVVEVRRGGHDLLAQGEDREHRLQGARGARIHARLAGAAGTADGYDLVAPHPEGEGAARAITAALRDAGLAPADIQHVNAHATSTPVGDTAEAAAIRSALGDHVMVSATKSQTGHLLGAAGALESVFTILALREQVVPATANLENPDDDAAVQALDIVRDEPRRTKLTAAVNDSFGFGGHNIALVFTTA